MSFKSTKKNHLFLRIISSIIIVAFTFTSVIPPSYAQSLNLPIPGTMVPPSSAFVPVLLKGMTIHPDDPLRFDFIIDSGNTDFNIDEIREESEKLVKYFLASMTVPKNDLWVNLSPYEQDRIIPEELGKTGLGRDLLAQDYILKQLTASLMYPEKELGKKFWDKVYKKAEEKFGTRDIPTNTFNKVWILPESATVYEHGSTVYVVDSKLKVMLDSDYMAMQGTSQATMELGESVVREIILPEIEREVNEGKNFAPLRQIYNSLILAKWYKETIKESLLSKVYVDQNKVIGVEVDDKTIKDQIYTQYMEAYKRGVYDYIKEDYDTLSHELIPRKYFSGGFKDNDIEIERTDSAMMVSRAEVGDNYNVTVQITPQKNEDGAMVGVSEYTRMVDGYSNRNNDRKELEVKELGPARKKADETTLVFKEFRGNTVIVRFDTQTQERLVEVKRKIEADLKKMKLHDKIAFVEEDSLHMTIIDLVNPDNIEKIKEEHPEYATWTTDEIEEFVTEKVKESFKELAQGGDLGKVNLRVRELGTFAPFLLLALAYPLEDQDLKLINAVREKITEKTKIKAPFDFVGHATLGYIVNPMGPEEYAAYKEIVDRHIQGLSFNLTIDLNDMEMSTFTTMEYYDTVFTAGSQAEEVEDSAVLSSITPIGLTGDLKDRAMLTKYIPGTLAWHRRRLNHSNAEISKKAVSVLLAFLSNKKENKLFKQIKVAIALADFGEIRGLKWLKNQVKIMKPYEKEIRSYQDFSYVGAGGGAIDISEEVINWNAKYFEIKQNVKRLDNKFGNEERRREVEALVKEKVQENLDRFIFSEHIDRVIKLQNESVDFVVKLKIEVLENIYGGNAPDHSTQIVGIEIVAMETSDKAQLSDLSDIDLSEISLIGAIQDGVMSVRRGEVVDLPLDEVDGAMLAKYIPGTLAWYRSRLMNKKPEIRIKSINALGNKGNDEDIGLIINMLQDDNESVVRVAEEFLSEEQINYKYIRLLESEELSPFERENAVKALIRKGNKGNDQVISIVLEESEHYHHLSKGISKIIEEGDQRVLTVLLEFFKDYPLWNAEDIGIIANKGDERVITVLLERLEDVKRSDQYNSAIVPVLKKLGVSKERIQKAINIQWKKVRESMKQHQIALAAAN